MTPYHLACQGPALDRYEVAVKVPKAVPPSVVRAVGLMQPGTSKAKLEKYVYLAKWNSTWLQSYTVNDFETKTGVGLVTPLSFCTRQW